MIQFLPQFLIIPPQLVIIKTSDDIYFTYDSTTLDDILFYWEVER